MLLPYTFLLQTHFTKCVHLLDVYKIAGCVANSVDRDQTSHSAASDLGLHCLLRPAWPNR